ncbi:hypothetical protein BH11CYA1_BH11CYA1_49800 [soil metagenome]
MPSYCPSPNLKFRRLLRLASFSVALTSIVSLTCDRPSFASEKAFSAKQSSISVGVSVCYLTSQAVRVDFGNDKVYLVAKAPSWKVVLYNSVTKCGMEMSYARWLAHHPKWNHGKDVDWVPRERLLKVGSPVIDGRKCTDYVLAEMSPSGRLAPKAGGNKGHFIVAQVEGVAPQALHILQRTVDMPQVTDFPLRLTINGKSRPVEGMRWSMGGDSHLLSTSSIKTVAVPSSIFLYPKSFKPMAFETEILYDSKTMNSNVEQFLNAFQ